MNKVFKLFSVLLMVGLVFGITACKEDEIIIPEITEFNVLGGWTDGGDGVYTLNTNTTSELDFTYDKATFPYAFMKSADITQDLSIFKKLVITVEGTGTMLIKLETSDTTPAKEVGLNVTGIQGTYEWNLLADSAFLAKVDQVVVIAAPGKEDSIGDIQVTQLKFDVAVADGFIIQSDFSNIPTNVNEYNGTDETFDFNMKWENFSEETYTISYVDTTTVVSFDKAAGQEWSTMQSQVQGDFTDFNFVVAIVTGTVGQKFLLKAANGYEAFVFLTAEEQEVVVDISEMTAPEKNAITAIFAFGKAGAIGTGDFVIHEAFMTAEYEYEAPVIIKNIYNGTDLSFAVTQWYDGGDLNYTLTPSGSDLVVAYNKTADWAFMVGHIEGDLSAFAKLEFEVTGTLNKTALFKVESPSGNIEQAVTFDGTRQTVVIDLSGMTPTSLSTINKVVIFAAPGGSGSGTFTLHSTTFMTSDFSLQDTWAENDLGTYAFSTTVDNTVLVTYTKVAQGWVFMKSVFTEEEVAGLNTLNITLKGTDGKQVLVKANGVEQWVTFSGTDEATVTFTASAFTEIIMFAEGGVDNATGTFEIVSAVLSYVAPDLDPTLVIDINSNWAENDLGTYAFTTVDGVVTVDYTKIAGQEWSFFRQNFDAQEVAGLNTLTMVLQGTAGKTVLIKPNDSGALEQAITFGAEPVTIVVYADAFANIIFFAEANTAPATGSFEILSATLSYTYMIEEWIPNVSTIYTLNTTDGVITVDYDKLAGNEWEWLRVQFNATEVEGLNTLTMVLSGTVGQTLLIKPNDSGALEQSITFANTDPMTLVFTTEAFANVFIFAEPNTAPASGTFTIHSATLSYVSVEAEWVGYNMTVAETATDVTITYPATPATWWDNNAQLPITGFDGTMNQVLFTFTGVLGHEYLFKIEGGGQAKELAVVGTGVEQTLLLPLDTMSEAQRDALNLIIVFVKTEAATGTLVLNTWEYGPVLPPADPEWVTVGTATVVTTLTETTITYTDTPANWWDNHAKIAVPDFNGATTSIVFTFTGVTDKEYVFKVEGGGAGVEASVIATGAEQTATISLSTLTQVQKDGLNLLVVFAKTTGFSGTVVITNIEYVVTP